MRIHFFIAIFILLLSHSVKAKETAIIDSLRSVIANASSDTTVSQSYLRWGELIYQGNPDTSVILFIKAKEIAERNLAAATEDNPMDSKVKKSYLEALAVALNNVGFILDDRGNIGEALEYYHKCLKIMEQIAQQEGIGTALNNLANIYQGQKDYSRALNYYHQCLKIMKEIGNKKVEANALNNIGQVYFRLNNMPSALEYHQKSLHIMETIKNKAGMSASYNNIGMVYKIVGDIPKSMVYFHKSFAIKKELNYRKGMATTLINLGDGELALGNLDQAHEYGERGLEIAREIGAAKLISNVAGLLGRTAKKRGTYEVALEMYELFIKMRDSVNNEETQKATIRQQTKYEFEKAQLVKEQEAKEASRQQQEARSRRDNLQYSVVLICLLVIAVVVAMLGRLSLPERVAEGIIFFAFLILFEFLLVLADPYIDEWSGGAPGFKLLFNAVLVRLVFPLHSFFEAKMKGKISG